MAVDDIDDDDVPPTHVDIALSTWERSVAGAGGLLFTGTGAFALVENNSPAGITFLVLGGAVLLSVGLQHIRVVKLRRSEPKPEVRAAILQDPAQSSYRDRR